ncbi:MAG: ATP-binding protein [bacterium]|nr:ATP-binding protein [bacterium]
MKSREKINEQVEEDLRKTREELAIQEWGNKKNLEGMMILVKELIQKGKEIKETRAKEETILENIGDGVLAVDRKGSIFLVNTVAERFLGLSAKEMIGKDVLNIINLEDEQGAVPSNGKKPILSTLLGNSPVSGTYYIKTKKKRFPASFTATSVMVNGRIEGAVVVFRDISREKNLEKLHADFLQLAAHQLRTPLSGIKWLIGTMQKKILGPLTKKQQEYLDDIYKINERMVGLVSDILNTLSLESSSVAAKNRPVLLSDFYKDIAASFEYVAKNRRVKLNTALEADEKLIVETDPEILKNIFESLISNAINYSAPGQEVIVGARKETDAVLCFVKDGGIGIPESENEDIFKRFYRASNAKKNKPDGTGLGLYIAKMLAEKIDAEIFFDSKEDKGSTFYVRIPQRVAANRL